MSLKSQLLTQLLKVPSNCQDKFACRVRRTIFHPLVFTYNSLDTPDHSLTSSYEPVLLIEFIPEKMGVDHCMSYSTMQRNRLSLSGHWKDTGFWKYTECAGWVPQKDNFYSNTLFPLMFSSAFIWRRQSLRC